MTTTALAVSKPQLTPDTFQMITQVAPTLHNARLFGTKSAEQAMAIMIKGFELGFSLTASFENVHVIQDKPSLAPKGALALILSSPLCDGVDIKDETDKDGKPLACSVTMKRKGGMTYTARFSMADAERAGVVKPDSGWGKYPANMLRWRAIGYCADIVFPDVIGGTKRADEFGADITPDGEVIDGSWQQVGSQPAPPQPTTVTVETPKPDPAARLNDLMERFGAEKIMNAAGGVIPGTNEQLDALEAKLGAENDNAN